MARQSRGRPPTRHRPPPIPRLVAAAPPDTPVPKPIPRTIKVGVWIALAVPFLLAFNLDHTNYYAFVFNGERGSEAFYSAAAQAIPTLVVALVIELKVFVRRVRRVLPPDPFLPVVILINVFVLAGGEMSALWVLNCEGAECGSPAEFANVVIALVAGFCLLAATTAMAFVED